VEFTKHSSQPGSPALPKRALAHACLSSFGVGVCAIAFEVHESRAGDGFGEREAIEQRKRLLTGLKHFLP